MMVKMVTWRGDKIGRQCKIEGEKVENRWTMEISSISTIASDYYDAGKSALNISNKKEPLVCNQEINTNGLSDFIVYGLLVNLIGLFGIFGNSISMIILSRPQMKSSINYLLIGLARCDTVLIIIAVSVCYIILYFISPSI